jgi:hypothetical protein
MSMTRFWAPLWAAGACAAFLSLVLVSVRFLPRPVDVLPPWEQYDPDSDEAWADISPGEVDWSVVEALEGMPAERVIDALGPPVHSRRRVEASTRCAAVYLYPIRTAGLHSTVGLCINRSGRVDGSVGQMKFNLKSY